MQKLEPVGKLFSDAWRLYKERFLVSMGILVVPAAVVGVGTLLLAIGGVIAILGLLILFVGFIGFIIAVVALIYSIIKGTDVAASYRASMPFFWPLVWVGLLAYFSLIGGLVLLFIPGLMMGMWFIFGQIVVIAEGKRGLEALSTSREYVRGYWWAVFGRYFLYAFLTSIVLAIIQAIAQAAFGKDIGSIVYFICWAIAFPFIFSVIYSIYKNLIVLKPNIATEKQTADRSWFIATGIIGIVVFVLFPVLFVTGFILAGSNGTYNANYPNDYYNSTSTLESPQPVPEPILQ